MATREFNIIMFPQLIDPECKVDVRIAEQFLENIDGLIMKGLRRDLAAAEARVLAGDVGAAEDAEFLFLSISRRLRDRDTIRREVIAWIFRVHDGARGNGAAEEKSAADELIGRLAKMPPQPHTPSTTKRRT
jgi:hypothetical protein